MSSRYEHYDSEEGYGDRVEPEGQDREISLGTTTVLGIFLALALVCALFFGFGYSMGRRSAPSALANVGTGISAPLPENKLTPGSLAPARSAYVPPTEGASQAAGATERETGAKAPQKTKPAAATADAGTAAASPAEIERRPVARAMEQAREQSVEPERPAAAPGVAAAGAGASYVQVAAISAAHKDDATMLKGSLERRGYAVSIRQGTQDQLLHVQIGPLASKKDAEAMRQRLRDDGYNAIVK